ncbi:MAG: hypothetical protein AB8B99_20640 [Phormidesmis sp.]
MSKNRGLPVAIKLIGLSVVGFSAIAQASPISLKGRIPPNNKCVIKGNISINSDRKLYHLPGMENYETTNIQIEHGERWFCSEQQAIAAGWVKAPR